MIYFSELQFCNRQMVYNTKFGVPNKTKYSSWDPLTAILGAIFDFWYTKSAYLLKYTSYEDTQHYFVHAILQDKSIDTIIYFI